MALAYLSKFSGYTACVLSTSLQSVSQPFHSWRLSAGVHGCSEHQFKLWRGLQDAKGNQRSLCAAWIDLENAYGSVHHDIIQFAMTHYYVPVQCQAIVKDLYRNLAVFVQSSLWRTDIIRFQKGVFPGRPFICNYLQYGNQFVC